MGRTVTVRLKQSDLTYSLLRLPTNERNFFPDSKFTLVFDDGTQIQTEFDKAQGRLRDRAAMRRYYQRRAISPNDLLIIEEIEPGRNFSLSSEKSRDPPTVQETIPIESDQEVESEEEGWTSFALEEDLRHFIVLNLDRIEKGLMLYRDKDGNDGEEYYAPPVGYIDVLAIDANGGYVVLELKVSRGPDTAVGQLLRYMGWVQKHIAAEKKVRGIILANEVDEKLRYAVEAASNLAVYKYEISFRLTEVPRFVAEKRNNNVHSLR